MGEAARNCRGQRRRFRMSWPRGPLWLQYLLPVPITMGCPGDSGRPLHQEHEQTGWADASRFR